MKRLAAALFFVLVLAPAPSAVGSGPLPYHTATAAPTGLHSFLLRPDEPRAQYYPRTPSFVWNPVSQDGGHYEFELATTRKFDDAGVLFRYSVTVPALAIDHQLPWMTGVPYALWAHVRWSDGKHVTPWSEPYGFNMRWLDTDYPQQEDAPPGLVRWKPIEGATGYEVLYPDIRPAVSFTTTTNVADEREFFTLHDNLGWGMSIRWRVRAIRYVNDKDVLSNGLPAVSYGPWSKTFVSVNPPKSLGTLAPTATISDNWDKPGKAATSHELTPGFAWQASAPVIADVSSFGSSLYRVYIATDDHCVNTVFVGSVVGSPAFAPRTTNGPRALPQSLKELANWLSPPYLTAAGSEGRSYDATGKLAKANEEPGQKLSSGSSSSSSSSSSSNAAATAQVDLWDSGWPTGRYYWTVVPVTVERDGANLDPSSNDVPIQYHDMAVPQDACESGDGMSFGKVSQPVVTQNGDPWVSGLAPTGRFIESAGRTPKVHDSPLVAWQPAVGATQYDVELARKLYPWKAVKKLSTYSTAIVLPLGKADVGTWYYRVRGINPALPDGAQQMSWSKPVQLRITGDQFVIVK